MNLVANNIIKRRILKRIEHIGFALLNIESVIVAGNSLNRKRPNDIDLFPVEKGDFDKILDLIGVGDVPGKILSVTENASTVRYFGSVIQFCNYHAPTLKELVESFDFSHIQIGALIKTSPSVSVEELYYTEAYEAAQITGTTTFVGSKYPLSSLVRAFKYRKRGDFPGNSHIPSVMKILTAIIERGFYGYDDFKDQLDAVDLGLLDEDFDMPELKKLFSLLDKGGGGQL